MKKEEIVALGIADDIAEKVANMSAEELKGYIPKARFDEVNEAKKNAEALVKERDGQLQELKKAAGASDELNKRIDELQAANKATAAEYEQKIKDMKIDSAIKEKLTGTQYVDLLLPKVDRTKITVSSDGTIAGIDEQITGLKDQYKDLFTPGVSGRGEGSKHGSLGGSPAKRAELEKAVNDTTLPLAERIAARNELFNLKED